MARKTEHPEAEVAKPTPKPRNYKPYTLKEYKEKKPDKYVELGKLAPDLMTDDLVAKRTKAERMKAFASNINKNNMKEMKIVPKEKREGRERKVEKEVSKREAMKEYAERVRKPVAKKNIPTEVVTVKEGRRRKEEAMASNGAYGDFEGSMYDDESRGFGGAEGLERGKKKTSLDTGIDQAEMARLDAENESARLQIERLKAEFGL